MATATPSDRTPTGNPEAVPPGAPERRGGLTPVSLFVVLLICFVLIKVQFVVILILVSLVLATTLERPVQLLERRLMLPRALAILLLYVAFFGVLILAGILVAPSVRDQVTIFADEAPKRLNELRASWQASGNGLLNGTGQDLLGRAAAALDNPPKPQQGAAIPVLTQAVGGIVGVFATLVITFYYLMERAFIRRVVLNEMSPRMRQRVSRIWDDAEAKVGGWLRGQLTLCLVIGAMSMIGYGIIGVPFWPVLGVWAGITEIIPVVGPWLGGIPAVVLALTQSTELALFTAIWAVVIQTSENWILVPRIMRGAVGLSPLTVFIAITAGAQFYGIVGTLLAIPIAAFVQVIVTQFLDERRDANQPAQPRGAIPAWRWMRGSSRDPGGGGPPPEPPRPRLGPARNAARDTVNANATEAAGRAAPAATDGGHGNGARSGQADADRGRRPASGAPASPAPPARSQRPAPAPAPAAPMPAASAARSSRTGPRWGPEQLRRPPPTAAEVVEPDAATGGARADDAEPRPAPPPAIGPGPE